MKFNSEKYWFDMPGCCQLESRRESLPIEGLRLQILKWLNKKPYLANGGHCLPWGDGFR